MSGSDWPLPIDEAQRRRDLEDYQRLHASLRRQDERDSDERERQIAAGKRDAAALEAGVAAMHLSARKARNAAKRRSANVSRCHDCGEVGEMTGHMGCQYPRDH